MALQQQLRLGVNKEWRREGYSADTLITTDNYGKVMLDQKTLILIANKVSIRLGRKLLQPESDELIRIIKRTPEDRMYGKTYANAVDMLTEAYFNRPKPLDEGIRKLAHVDDENLHEIQKAEVNQLTPNEDDYNFRAFAPRNGYSVVDADKITGNRSTPNGLPASTVEDIAKVAVPTLQALGDLISPKNLENIATKFRNAQRFDTYGRIGLVRQQILLDSRNRQLSRDGPASREWDLFKAGSYGNPGTVQLRENLQGIIEMTLSQFWLPISNIQDTYYGFVNLYINELHDQSTPMTEFLGPSQRDIKGDSYVWQLRIERVVGNNALLVPTNPSYRFRLPVARLEHITLRFYSPFSQLQIQQDFLTFTVVYGNPTVLNNPIGSGQYPEVHNISTGDLIYIYNSNVSSLNRESGWFATRINATTITIPADTSAIPGSQSNVQVFIGGKRIIVQFNFVCLDAGSG